MSSSNCHSVSATATISQCLNALVEHSERPDNNTYFPSAKRILRSNNNNNDALSPWGHTAVSRSNAAERKHPRKREKTSPSSSPSSSSLSPPARRATSAKPSSRHSDDPARNSNVTTGGAHGKRKHAKFRGFLDTLWCSGRPEATEPSFQHFSDVGDYIELYRAHHQPVSAVPATVTVDPCENNCRPHTYPGRNAGKSTAARETAGRGETPKRCSRAQKGCPHYVPRSPCVRNHQSDGATSRPPRTAPHVTSAPAKMAVRGEQLESGKHNAQGERGRNTFRFGKGRRRVIVAESPKCKRIYLTWRQYVKYFSQPASRSQGQNDNGNDKDDDEVDGSVERDDNSGYAERPATPHQTAAAEPFRAATCVPVLDYDQSRVGTPVSPFRVPAGQSARSRHARSATSQRSVAAGDLDFDQWRAGRTTPASPIRIDQPARSKSAWSAQRSSAPGRSTNSPGLSSEEDALLNPWQPQLSSEKKRQTCKGGRVRVNATRTRLAICTAIDIQTAVRDLALSLGTKKPLLKHTSSSSMSSSSVTRW